MASTSIPARRRPCGPTASIRTAARTSASPTRPSKPATTRMVFYSADIWGPALPCRKHHRHQLPPLLGLQRHQVLRRQLERRPPRDHRQHRHHQLQSRPGLHGVRWRHRRGRGDLQSHHRNAAASIGSGGATAIRSTSTSSAAAKWTALTKANEPPAGKIRNVIIQNVIAHGTGASVINGHPDSWLEGVRLDNVKLFVSSDPAAPYEHTAHCADRPPSNGLRMSNVEIDWEKPFASGWTTGLSARSSERRHSRPRRSAPGARFQIPSDCYQRRSKM